MLDILKDIMWIITTIAVPVLTYFVGKFKQDKVQNEALKMLLQSKLTSVYFVYEEVGEIPDYIYKNWKSMLSTYEALDGDDYIHELDKKMEKFKIVKTDILK